MRCDNNERLDVYFNRNLFVCLSASTCAMPLKSSNREKRKHCSKKKDSKFTAKAKWFFSRNLETSFLLFAVSLLVDVVVAACEIFKSKYQYWQSFSLEHVWCYEDIDQRLEKILKDFSEISDAFVAHPRVSYTTRRKLPEADLRKKNKELLENFSFIIDFSLPHWLPKERSKRFDDKLLWHENLRFFVRGERNVSRQNCATRLCHWKSAKIIWLVEGLQLKWTRKFSGMIDELRLWDELALRLG